MLLRFQNFGFSFCDTVEATSITWTQNFFFLLSIYTVSNPAIPKFKSQI